MKQLQLLVAVAMLSLFGACQQVNFQKTSSGIVYKIFPGKLDSPKLKVGQFVKFDLEYAIPEKDTVLPNGTFGKIPGYTKVDTGKNYAYSIIELMPLASVGDSVEFTLSIDTLKKLGAIPDYNKVFAQGGMIHGKLKIMKSFNNEPDVTADYQKESDKEKDREIKDIQDYLDKKGIKAQKTDKGVFVALTNPGDAAAKADTGKQLSIMYKGTLLTNGEVFDTNMDTSKHHTDPIKVVLGQGSVIPGWEDGLKLFAKGAKGTIYVPAMLGYGPRGDQPTIPAYANLVFDIEVIDITAAPKQQPEGGGNPMNHLTPAQMKQLQEQMQQQQQQQNGGAH